MMDQMKEKICRLCLKCGDDTFSDFSDLSSKEKLKAILPELNVDNPSDFVICSKCRTSLEWSYQFIENFIENDNFIRRAKDDLKIVDSININLIIEASSGVKLDMYKNVCRICLKSNAAKYSNFKRAATDTSFSNIMGTCLSKLDKDLTLNPVICESCHHTIRDMHTFITKCMIVEKKVAQFSETSSEKQVDLNKVLDSLDKTQLEEQLSGNELFGHSQDTEINKKRPLPDEESGTPSKKGKGRKSTDSLKEYKYTDLPHFGFNYNLFHYPISIIELEEWISKVDNIKNENNWTDLMTINKVLEKLNKLSEIYTWFSNISKIFTWEEWKKKLISVFPYRDDYGILVKKVVNKRKKPTQTYIDYYNEKIGMLKLMDITGEEAVSCLIGGIPDIAAACAARAGNYKNPDELMLHFKTWDSRHPVIAEFTKENNNEVPEKPLPEKQPLPEKIPQNKPKRCSVCRRTTHAYANCPKIRILNDLRRRTNKQIESQREITESKKLDSLDHLKHNNKLHEKTQDTVERPQSHKASEKPLNSSPSSQKQSEQKSSTTTQDKGNKNASNVKEQENLVVNSSSNSSTSQEKRKETNRHSPRNKQASTSTMSKQSKDIDKGTKQDQSDGKGMGGATTGKPNKQSNDDACFVKPLPPSRKSTSASPQNKGSSLKKNEVAAGGTPAAKQNEGSSKKDNTEKSQSKENKVGTSNVKTQAQSKESTSNRNTSSTMLREHNEKNNKSTSAATHEDQTTKNNTSKANSSKPQDRSKEKATALKAQSKGSDFVNFVKPQAPVGRSSGNRGSGKRKEVGYRSTSAASTKYWRDERYFSRDPSQRDVEERAGGYSDRGRSAALTQDWRDESYFNRDIPSDRLQRYLEDRAMGYYDRGMSDTPQDWRNEGYFNRDISSARYQGDIEERGGGYFDRGASAALTQDWRDESYFSRDITSDRLQRDREDTARGYYDRGMLDTLPQDWRDESYFTRDVSSAEYQRYLEERAAGYSNRGTFTDSSQDWRREPYFSRDIPNARSQRDVEESYVNTGISAASLQDPREEDYFSRGIDARSQEYVEGRYLGRERDAGYVSTGMADIRPQELSEGSYPRRDLSNARFGEHLERGESSIRSWEEREASFHEPREQGGYSVAPYEERESRYQEHREQGVSSVRSQEEREARFQEPRERGVSSGRLHAEMEARYQEPRERGVSGVRSHEEREARFHEPREHGVSSIEPHEEMQARFYEPRERGTSSVRPHEERESRFQEPRERGVSSARPHAEREARYQEPREQSISSARLHEEKEARFQEPRERGVSSARPHAEREARYQEPREQSVSSARLHEEREARFQEPRERGVSSVRPLEERESRFEEHREREASSIRPQEEREMRFQKPRELDASIVRSQEERASRFQDHRERANVRPHDDRESTFQDRVERGTSNVRSHEEQEVRHQERVERGASSARPHEERESRFQERVERSTSSVRPQEEREMSRTERIRSQEIERDTINKGILKTRSSVQDDSLSGNYNTSGGVRSADEWESSYVDRGITSAKQKEQEKEGVINKVAPNDRQPVEKEMEGRGFRSAELTERTYLDRDAPSVTPRDGSYANRVAPAANPSDRSYLSGSTTSERLPLRSEGSYFNKSISSTRLLGSSLGSLFNLSLASRPFTSYPSCATTAKPLGITDGTYFNRGLSHNRLRANTERSKGLPNEIFSRRNTTYDARTQELTTSSYNKGLPSTKHQEQSHRSLCVKCYTIGHNSVDCPKFRI